MHRPLVSKIRTSAFAAGCLLLAAAWAAPARADVQIEASVSRASAAIGEEIVLDFIVTNASGSVSKPVFPPLDGFTSYSQGHSQEIAFVNGRMSSKSIYSYVLIPNAVGKKNLGPFEITIAGVVYKVAPIEINVTQQPTFPSGRVSSPAYPQGPAVAPSPRALPQGGVSDRDIFVRAWLDKDEVYVNEPAMLTYTLYTRLSATYKGFEKEPVLTGFWVEDFPPEKTIQRTEQIFNGSRYVVADVRKVALFPTQAGVFTIDTGTLSAVVEVRDQNDSFNSFFSSNVFGRRTMYPPSVVTQMVQQTIPADKAVLTVKALPAEGRPSSFTGAVGKYLIESEVDKDTTEVGSPITYRVRLSGRGNISTVQMPSLTKLEDFRVYDSSTSVNVKKDRLIVEGEKIVETVIVPKKAGVFTVPPLEFSYFDLGSAQYKKLRTVAQVVSVKPGVSSGEEETAPEPLPAGDPVRKEDVALAGKDIRYVKTAVVPALVPPGLHRRPAWWAINSLLVLATAVFALLERARRKASKDRGALRRRESHRAARTKLKAASAALKSGRREDFYREATKAVQGYFADKFNVSPQAVTAALVEERAGGDLDPELLKTIRSLFDELGYGRFASGPDGGEESLRRAYALADRVISSFEKVKVP